MTADSFFPSFSFFLSFFLTCFLEFYQRSHLIAFLHAVCLFRFNPWVLAYFCELWFQGHLSLRAYVRWVCLVPPELPLIPAGATRWKELPEVGKGGAFWGWRLCGIPLGCGETSTHVSRGRGVPSLSGLSATCLCVAPPFLGSLSNPHFLCPHFTFTVPQLSLDFSLGMNEQGETGLHSLVWTGTGL